EPASPIRDDSQGVACPTDSGLEAEQDRANITKTSTLPSDSTLRITSLTADEGNAPIKGRSLDEGEEAAEKGSDDTKEMVTVLTSLDATTFLSSGVSMARQLEEEMERDAQRMNEQIVRDAEIAKIHAEEELQIMIDGLDRNNETVAKYLQEYYQKQQKEFYMSVLKSHACWKARYFKEMILEEIKEKFDLVWKQFQDFIPIGSKEESERFKRKGIRLEPNSAKKLKTSEEVPEEMLKEIMELISVEEVYVEAL
nr:hypothetical protein [Tanacetum cinerariifolium]